MHIEEFNTLSQLENHLEEKYQIGELISDEFTRRDSGDSSFFVLENDDEIAISTIAHDGEYYDDEMFNPEASEYNGQLIIFSSSTERDEKVSELSKKTKPFYLLDRYQHGNVHYSVSGTENYPDSRWDVSHGCAVYITSVEENKEFKKTKKTEGYENAYESLIPNINKNLDTYSKICNGETYMIITKTFDKKGELMDEDNCGGYIGDNAKEEILSTFNYKIKLKEASEIAKNVDIKTINISDSPIKINKENVSSIKMAQVYDDILVAVSYSDEKQAIVYHKKDGIKKTQINPYSETQIKYNVSAEEFLNNNLSSSINNIIMEKLKDSNKQKITP